MTRRRSDPEAADADEPPQRPPRPAWLAHAHAALDEAAAEAYGWGEDWRAGRLDDDAILARLFALNQQRAGKGGGG